MGRLRRIRWVLGVLILAGVIGIACGSSGTALTEVEPTAGVTILDSGTVPPLPTKEILPDMGSAPDILNEVWLNSEPMTLSGLQGKVVLVEFWTFG